MFRYVKLTLAINLKRLNTHHYCRLSVVRIKDKSKNESDGRRYEKSKNDREMTVKASQYANQFIACSTALTTGNCHFA